MKITCEMCGRKVGDLAEGSTYRKGTVYICRECAEEMGIIETKSRGEAVYPQPPAGWTEIFNDILKGNKL